MTVLALTALLAGVAAVLAAHPSRRGAVRWNRRRLAVGAALVACGIASAVVVRVANDGEVPATVDAVRAAGRTTVGAGAAPERVSDRVPALGDLLAWPAPLPLSTTFGVPTVLVIAGAATLGSARRRADPAAAYRGPIPVSAPDRPLVLSTGRLWCDARSTAAPVVVEVRAEDDAVDPATMRIREGRAGLEIGPRGGLVVVVDGSVEIVRGGSTTVVEAGWGIELRADHGLGPALRLDPAEITGDPWIGPLLDRDPPTDTPDVTTPSAPAAARRHGDRRGRRPAVRPWLTWAPALGVAAFAVLSTYVVQIAAVPSDSMEPTLQPGDRIVVAKAAGAPTAGDIVVVERPPVLVGGSTLLVKRVVAVGGQTVEIRDGRVWVDGRRAPERYLAAGTTTEEPCGPRGVTDLPPGTLYLLGDARADSTDSRCFGPVPMSSVVGTVTETLRPPS